MCSRVRITLELSRWLPYHCYAKGFANSLSFFSFVLMF